MSSEKDHEEMAQASRAVFECMVNWRPSFARLASPKKAMRRKVCALCIPTDPLYAQIQSGRYSSSREQLQKLEAARAHISKIGFVTQDAGHNIGEWGFLNIFDLLLFAVLSGWDRPSNTSFYRGQADASWHLEPSSCRGHLRRDTKEMAKEFVRSIRSPSDSPGPYLEHLESHWNAERETKREQLRRERPEIARRLEQLKNGPLSEFEEEAIIQHYLSGTPLIDVTQSIYVAAFFATRGAANRSVFGAIYPITQGDIERGARFLRYQDVPPEFLRIHRQEGAFLLLRYPTLVDWSGHFMRWCFHQTVAGRDFESSALGITSAYLLAE